MNFMCVKIAEKPDASEVRRCRYPHTFQSQEGPAFIWWTAGFVRTGPRQDYAAISKPISEAGAALAWLKNTSPMLAKAAANLSGVLP